MGNMMGTDLSQGIQLSVTDEGALVITMAEDVFKQFQEIADKRGKTLIDVFVEALRLENLFADVQGSEDRGLLIREGDQLKEVVAF